VRAATARADYLERATVRGNPIAETGESRPAADDRASHAVIRDTDAEGPVLAKGTHRDLRGQAMLDRVRDRLTGDEVGGGLDARRDPFAGSIDLDGNRCCPWIVITSIALARARPEASYVAAAGAA
jgi:hypothetical protein